MSGELIGLVAVVLIFSVPGALMYTFYRVRKLRTEERLAAIARGVAVPMEPDLSQTARSRRAGILLVAGAVGYMLTFGLVARIEPDACGNDHPSDCAARVPGLAGNRRPWNSRVAAVGALLLASRVEPDCRRRHTDNHPRSRRIRPQYR